MTPKVERFQLPVNDLTPGGGEVFIRPDAVTAVGPGPNSGTTTIWLAGGPVVVMDHVKNVLFSLQLATSDEIESLDH